MTKRRAFALLTPLHGKIYKREPLKTEVFRDAKDYIGKIDITAAVLTELTQLLFSYAYDDYDRLIQLCDGIALPTGSVSVEERITDVKKRYGSYPEENRHKTLELKRYFEENPD